MRLAHRLAAMLLAGALWPAGDAAAVHERRMVVERAVLVMRHGIRAPLPEEIPAGTRTSAPWPRWSVPASRITPHGARALEIVAAQDRRLLAAAGLFGATGCPQPSWIRITSNSSDRTITSGDAYARGFAPGCGLHVDHRPIGVADPLFEPLRAHATGFDGAAAVADIKRDTGGMAALVARHRRALALLDHVLGCGGACIPAAAPEVTANPDGSDITLSGPIRAASGIAQVLLLEHLEGMPRHQVGWGRADAKTLQRLGALHAALFAVFTRPPYMAAHQAGPLAKRIVQSLATGPRLQVFMGHDTNVTALAAALRIDLVAPGYATNDVPPGGALMFERLRNTKGPQTFVRVSYRTQAPAVLRSGGNATTVTPLRIPGCGGSICPAARFAHIITGVM